MISVPPVGERRRKSNFDRSFAEPSLKGNWNGEVNEVDELEGLVEAGDKERGGDVSRLGKSIIWPPACLGRKGVSGEVRLDADPSMGTGECVGMGLSVFMASREAER